MRAQNGLKLAVAHSGDGDQTGCGVSCGGGAAQVGDEDEIRLLAAYLEADVNASDARTFNFTVTSLLPSLPESE